jgi:hypothetical protein
MRDTMPYLNVFFFLGFILLSKMKNQYLIDLSWKLTAHISKNNPAFIFHHDNRGCIQSLRLYSFVYG